MATIAVGSDVETGPKNRDRERRKKHRRDYDVQQPQNYYDSGKIDKMTEIALDVALFATNALQMRYFIDQHYKGIYSDKDYNLMRASMAFISLSFILQIMLGFAIIFYEKIIDTDRMRRIRKGLAMLILVTNIIVLAFGVGTSFEATSTGNGR